ncbi:hypothetical protein [Winogradskya humida]|uniref:ABC-type transport system involved in multi-copper enzyme maturation permease subunit n=1 Tax=Winogradskya humida TaxID=113566 RepID=A0ABQ3ZY67_9ACTN|nr:hypothetical protein [Actinoplanes humidus]GIE23556.1 hypothetical protein Ahu01nite_066580 [Actinoplanes humidus]
MNRILGIELRRSAAIGTALTVAVIGSVLLFFAEGIYFSDGWLQLAMTQRLYLALLWPLALAAGAWQARREGRANVGELFASTPRPRVQRTAPTLGVMTVAVVVGYLLMGLAGGLWIIGTARYLPVAVFAVTAVGLLSLIAAVWLGMAAGRLMPWLVTAPLMGVAGLALLLSLPGATRPRGWLALVFSPIYEMNMPDAFQDVPGRASASQAIWLAALAATAVMLLVSSSWRLRVAALLPVILGATLAIGVMPHGKRVVIGATDPASKELVCAQGEPGVCVGRVHSGLLSEVTSPAREGLAVLAKLPGAPTQVHEDTTTFLPDAYPTWHDDVVLLRVETGPDGHLLNSKAVQVEVVSGAFSSPPQCEKPASYADTMAAAFWLMGQEPKADLLVAAPEEIDEVATVWQGLQALPAAEAQSQLQALRKAALTCSGGDRLLTGSPK